MGDGASLARYALDRMQHHKARAAGPEVGLRHHLDREDEAPLVLGHDIGAEDEHPVGGLDARVVADTEAVVAFVDLKVRYLRRVGLPAGAAHDEGEAAQRFRAAIADPAQLAGVERNRKRTGAERLHRRHGILGAVELEGFRRCRRHVAFPVPA